MVDETATVYLKLRDSRYSKLAYFYLRDYNNEGLSLIGSTGGLSGSNIGSLAKLSSESEHSSMNIVYDGKCSFPAAKVGNVYISEGKVQLIPDRRFVAYSGT
ncbi:MAG: hypothetical protein HGA85_04050 [Nanoarchaeota archaeon]|nr:hypothetical protein [Nanoarchaeota archaeon]